MKKCTFFTAALIGLFGVTAAGAEPRMTYAGLIKVMQHHEGAENISRLVVGKQISVTLKETGPHALMVDPKDRIFFDCKKRDPSFKGGSIISRIIKYEETPNGDPAITLAECKSK